MPEVKNIDAPSEYPVLKKGRKNKQIVLFTAENTGIVLDAGESNYQIGRLSDQWKEQYFDKHDEPVLVQND